MPLTFEEREQAFEAKFAHDEEMRFLIAARRDKLFGKWAAGELGLGEQEGNTLIKAILAIPDGPGHDRVLLAHVAELMRGQESEKSRRLAAMLTECAQQAQAQLTAAPPPSEVI